MARFTAYDKKTTPDATDTVLVYDNEASPDTLKQVEIQALFESYTMDNGKTAKELINALQTAVAAAAIARYQ